MATLTTQYASVWPQLEPVLTSVRKPARYSGGEGNAVVKDHATTDSRWLLVYPDAYEVGQPNQGVQILYEVLNERPRTVAERGYAPWEVRVECDSYGEARELAERLEAEGYEAFVPEGVTTGELAD